jgi:hypothetical protein
MLKVITLTEFKRLKSMAAPSLALWVSTGGKWKVFGMTIIQNDYKLLDFHHHLHHYGMRFKRLV